MIGAVARAIAMLAARFARAIGCFLLRATRVARRRRADAVARDAPSCLPSKFRRTRTGASEWPTSVEEATAVDPLRELLEKTREVATETMRSVRSDRAVRVTFLNVYDARRDETANRRRDGESTTGLTNPRSTLEQDGRTRAGVLAGVRWTGEGVQRVAAGREARAEDVRFASVDVSFVLAIEAAMRGERFVHLSRRRARG